HFYKTLNPQTNFGPFTPNAVMNEIAQGGVFISYIGHSGTATWDNNLTNPDQLLNNSNRGSMVTDFGCSTNKFAEPDIECFGARFVNNGQAIAYVGNATLGFSSTTSLMSELFYKYFFEDSVSNIAQAHRLSKNHMLTQAGTTRAYRYFALSNTLIGDPMVNLALPRKVNLTVNNEEYFSLEKTDPSEEDSLAVVTIRYDNIGSVTTDTVTINVTVMHNNVNTVQKMFRRAIPKNSDTLMVALPVRRLIGTHLVTVEIDPESALDEYSRSDNKYTYSINVLASALRGIVKSDFSSEIDPVINVLNPILEPANKNREAIMQYDTTESFTTAQVKTIPIDTFVTKVPLNTLTADKDYFLRFRLNSTDTSWSGSSTIRKGLKNSPFLVEGKKSLTKQKLVNSYFDGQGIKIKNDTLHFVVNSCGINFKAFGSMTLNDSVLVQGIGTGMNIVIVDSATLQVETAEFFNYGNIAYRFDSLVALINRTPFGKIVFMGIVSDGITSTNLFDNPILKDAILSLGAKLIEQLGYQYPWVLMGKKGLAKGQAKEDLKTRAYLDTLQLDTTLYRINKTGYFTTLPVKTAGKWKQLTIDYTAAGDGTVKVRPIVLRANGITDTLQYLNIAANTADLSVLDTVNAQSVRFEVSLGLSSSGISPVLKSLAADFDGLPELGFNYETVRLSRQEMKLGKTDSLFITVLNGGYFKASSVNLLVELQDGSKRDTIDQRVIPQVNPGDKFYINLPYNPGTGEKNRNFIVTIDPEKKIPDYVSDNNTFRLPFTVSVDSTLKPYITAYADSSALIDGDFIPAKPTLHFELFDPTIIPINDTANVISIYDNDTRVVFKNNPELSYKTSTANPKLTFDYKPTLSGGDHTLEIKALSGTKMDTITYKVSFVVNDELQILQLYNYPNPFKDKTNFAFQLSKVPETFYIKIYTVAGRLIKTIETTSGALKVGYNKSLVWDGRDADGNNVASGVYLAKVIAKLQGKTFTSTMKLAVVR
ncbi:MAG: T9SS type A sorting domain-containing protein, partial [Ignavibacteriales bacterium]|nr:T9SS type A sorting domain-containing protein [Ignavibacteriales bacterium]